LVCGLALEGVAKGILYYCNIESVIYYVVDALDDFEQVVKPANRHEDPNYAR